MAQIDPAVLKALNALVSFLQSNKTLDQAGIEKFKTMVASSIHDLEMLGKSNNFQGINTVLNGYLGATLTVDSYPKIAPAAAQWAQKLSSELKKNPAVDKNVVGGIDMLSNFLTQNATVDQPKLDAFKKQVASGVLQLEQMGSANDFQGIDAILKGYLDATVTVQTYQTFNPKALDWAQKLLGSLQKAAA